MRELLQFCATLFERLGLSVAVNAAPSLTVLLKNNGLKGVSLPTVKLKVTHHPKRSKLRSLPLLNLGQVEFTPSWSLQGGFGQRKTRGLRDLTALSHSIVRSGEIFGSMALRQITAHLPHRGGE
jgi:hypothetical protein